MPATKLLSTAQAAAQLKVHRSTLTRMVQAGKIRAAAKGDGIRGGMFFYPSQIQKARILLAAERGEQVADGDAR